MMRRDRTLSELRQMIEAEQKEIIAVQRQVTELQLSDTIKPSWSVLDKWRDELISSVNVLSDWLATPPSAGDRSLRRDTREFLRDIEKLHGIQPDLSGRARAHRQYE
jgi:hypothetical protein